MRIALVIPCFDEAQRLDVDAVLAFAQPRPWLTIWGVDDGSSDATLALWQGLARRCPQIHAVSLGHNQGKGEAVRQGLLTAMQRVRPDAVAYFDADLATPLTELEALIAALQTHPGAQLAMGSRVKLLGRNIQRDERRHYLGRIFATAVSQALSLGVYDTQCGAKLLRVGEHTARWLEQPFSSRWVFDVELLFRMRATLGTLDGAVVEVPLTTWVEQGDTRIRPEEALRMPLELYALWRRYRPTSPDRG